MHRTRLWLPPLAIGLALAASGCGGANQYGSFPHPGENGGGASGTRSSHPRNMTIPSPNGRGSEQVFTTVPGTAPGGNS